MPRTTHPRSRHRHGRDHVRFHRDRIVKMRGRAYRARHRTVGFYMGVALMDWDRRRFYGPWGELENELAWMGCRSPRCGLCSIPKVEARRERRREDRRWRQEWDVL